MAVFTPGLFLSQAYILAQMTACQPAQQAPRVEVYFAPQKPIYVTDAPVKVLTQAMAGNRDVTHGSTAQGTWRVFGITESQMGNSDFQVSYSGLIDNYGNKCIYVDTVKCVVHYKPIVYIGAELKDHDCHFKVTKLHEERHVATDLKVLKQYIPKIKMEILWYLRSLGPQGPYPSAEAPKHTKRIVDEVIAAVRPIVDKLSEARRKHQGDIDTIENYKYESGLCPGEWPKVE